MFKNNKFSKKIKSGFSLIEFVVVIAIIGVLTAVVINNSAGTRESANISAEKSNINMLTTAIQGMFGTQGTYTGLTNEVMITSNSFPKSMAVVGDATKIKTSWDSDGVQLSSEDYVGSTDAAFSMTYSSVPAKSCVEFVNSVFNNYYKIDVNGTMVRDLEGSATTTGDVAAFSVACGSANSTIIFYSR